MKNLSVFLSAIFVFFSSTQAQEAVKDPQAWQTSLEAGLGLTQAAYSDNWTGGEVGSIVWAANIHATAQKQLSPKFRHENDLKLAFGQTHSQNQESKKWASPMKSSDKIRFDTILKLTLDVWVDPYVAGIFESQFYDASYPLDKRYVNPIKLTETVGASRTLFDNSKGKMSTRVGFGFRQTLAQAADSAGQVIVESQSTMDGGFEWVTDWKAKVSDTMTYTTKLSLFQALFYSESDKLTGTTKEYWKTTDMSWENIVAANVAKFMQVSLAWELQYDKELDLGGRFKETLAIGVSYIM